MLREKKSSSNSNDSEHPRVLAMNGDRMITGATVLDRVSSGIAGVSELVNNSLRIRSSSRSCAFQALF